MFLGDDVEDLWTVCEETLDHLQDVVREQRHAQLVDEHLQPLDGGKLTAVLAIASDHGREQLVELVVDLYAHLGAPGATALSSLNNEVERERE